MGKSRAAPLILGVFTVLFSLVVPNVYAGGRAEQSLARADALIAEKQYDEAIKILTEFSRKNPERFGEAQSRLQAIYKIREEFNAVAGTLIDEVVSDEPDMEQVLALTNRLRELENSNNPQIQDFIRRAYELAQFSLYRQRLARILDEGRRLIDLGSYEEALRVYAGGMDIYRDEFFAAGYGEIINDQVSGRIADVNTVVATFPAAAQPLRTAAAELGRVSAQGVSPAELEEPYNRLTTAMDALADLERLLYAAADYYDAQLAEFQRLDESIGDRNYLLFASRLIRGRSGEAVQEGMLGALDGYWNSAVAGAEAALQDRTNAAFEAGLAAANSRQYETSRGHFVLSGEYSRYPLNMVIKKSESGGQSGSAHIELFGETILQGDRDVFLKYRMMTEAAGFLVQGCDLGAAFEGLAPANRDSVEQWQSGNLTAAAVLDSEQAFQNSLGGVYGGIDALIASIDQREAELRDYQAAQDENAAQSSEGAQYLGDARTVASNIRTLILNERRQSSARYYAVANGDLEKRLAAYREQFAAGSEQINGISRETEDRGTVIERFPAEGLAAITGMLAALADDTREGSALAARYAAEPPEIASGEEIAAHQNSSQAMMGELESLQSRAQALVAPTRNLIAEADAYRQDGVRYYREAQNALGRQNFDTARDRVTRAAEQFTNSLDIQESSALRNEWDTQIYTLGQEINRLENELVIRDVRSFVNDARTLYFGGNFEQAENLLVRAQNRWHVTNAEDDEEVAYWLTIVRGAASLRSDRVIPLTAPLYPEMSQLLSDAKQKYDEGVRFLNAGQRGDGLAKFTEARQKTREVKLMFPVNQEAGMLDLRMDQVTDPRAFDSSFEQRMRAAIAGTKRRSIESFADLQNLAEINPRYGGMAGIVTQAEIDMGFRPPPPDPRAIARSNELRALAQRALDGNNTAQFEVALTQINEAITLNPSNTEATIIKDRLLTRISSRAGAIVMNSQDEAAYNQALMEYQQGNHIMALAIVQRLLQNPQYRNISKLVELQRRVQTQL